MALVIERGDFVYWSIDQSETCDFCGERLIQDKYDKWVSASFYFDKRIRLHTHCTEYLRDDLNEVIAEVQS